ncbi:MAG TPA: PP0621 family protein [Burkholderiales bacterium]|nr:PP0621 family protein [Burkholderiales bacterium]
MKYFILVLVIVLVYWFFKAHKRKVRGPSRRSSGGTGASEDMVRCAQCGVHLPRSESLMAGKMFFCTPEHRRLHQKSD